VFAVDVAKEDFVAALMKPDRSVLVTIKWQHPQETRAMMNTLIRHVSVKQLEVVLEPSGTYGDPVREAFTELGAEVYMASPKRVHDAAEIYDGVPSLHDAKAAYLIGRLHLEEGSRPWPMISEARKDLKAAISIMDLHREQEQRDLNRLEGLLARHWPEADGLLKHGSITLLTLLERYGSPSTIIKNRAQARQLMQRTGRWFLKGDKIVQLLDSAETTLGLACSDLETRYLQSVARDTLRAHREARRAQRVVESLASKEGPIKSLSPVIGKVTSAVLIAHQGVPTDYSSAGSYLKALGLNLKEHSSGKHRGQLKITKRGHGISRRYLYYATLRLIRDDNVVRAWYRSKVERDGGRIKGKAIIAVMRKLVQALWYVSRGETFDSKRLFDVRHLGLVA
jgi:transposase